MQRNLLKTQFFSIVNPDALYQLPYRQDGKTHHSNLGQKNKELSSNMVKTQTNTEQKRKYLTLVSKQKKGLKKTKGNKKLLTKKCNSVILGGQKKVIDNPDQSNQSTMSSHCRSCTNLRQFDQTSILQSPRTIQPSFQNLTPQRALPLNLITQPAQNNSQLTKIISHKLKIDAIQPHQFFSLGSRNNLGVEKRDNNLMERRLLRNVSTGSVGRVHFSVNGSVSNLNHEGQKKEIMTQRSDRPFITPRFDKQPQPTPRKRRPNAGFIRSASARKHSPSVDNNHHQQKQQITGFPTEKDSTQKLISPTPKQLEINQCINKMSLIRKQIDELQSMIHQRLQTSQLRSKAMYGSMEKSHSAMKQTNIGKEAQHFIDRKSLTHRESNLSSSGYQQQSNRNSRVLGESRTATIVNDLNNLSRSLSMSKAVLMQTSKVEHRLNIVHQPSYQLIQMPLKPHTNTSYQHINSSAPSYHSVSHHPLQSHNDIFRMKYPITQPQQNLEKQLVHQFATNRNTSFNKEKRINQENIIANNIPSYYSALNRLR